MQRLKVLFSNHARYQIKERKLSATQVRRIINRPDKLISQANNRFLAYKLIKKSGKDYLLIVVYERENSSLTVVTTFLTSKLHKYL